MDQASKLSPLALFKRVIITALAATAPGGTGHSVDAARRDACPRWPQKDFLVSAGADRCDAGFDTSAALWERIKEKEGMKKVLKDVARIDRSQCFPDKVLFTAYFMLKYSYKLYPQPWQPEYWQSGRRARVFGDDTLVMPTKFTMDADRLDRHLTQRTRSIWAHHRIAFCATLHSSPSQYQFTAWAGRSYANSRFIAFSEGSRASFVPEPSFNGAWHIGGHVM